jgi:hypothetical protein
MNVGKAEAKLSECGARAIVLTSLFIDIFRELLPALPLRSRFDVRRTTW